jgi:NTE family protein
MPASIGSRRYFSNYRKVECIYLRRDIGGLGLAACWALAGCQTPPPVAASRRRAAAAATAPAPLRHRPPPPRPPRIGLALGGGAARGFAHIGVIQVLDEAGIRPDLAVGTSAGSLVAALWASGLDGAALGRMAASMEESTIADWGFPGRGLLRGDALARYVRERTGGRRSSRCRARWASSRPTSTAAARCCSAVATPAWRCVPRAQCRRCSRRWRSMGREYVDGGLVAPVPVAHARQMGAELVIAVDIGEAPEGRPTGDRLRLLLQTFAIMGRSISRHELRDADIVIRPALAAWPAPTSRHASGPSTPGALRRLPPCRRCGRGWPR